MNKIWFEIRRKWKPRKKTAHKGDFGRLMIVAGSEGYTGAAHLASRAALLSGAGLVTLAVPRKIYSVAARRESEVMVRPFASTKDGTLSVRALGALLRFAKTQDVLAVGPGLSQNPETQKLIRAFVLKTGQPLVLDADGLNAFRGHLGALKRRGVPTLLTPHPGEFVRLFGGCLSSNGEERKKRALDAARLCRAVVVLKGHQTVVAGPDHELYVNSTGNPGMAKGGTGDVLTGMITALIAQKFSVWDSARFGVYLHGLAGDIAAKKSGQISLCAGDIIDQLPQLFKKILSR